MRSLMPGLDEFNRGVLNQWSDSNADHPLGQERVQKLMTTVIDPYKVIMVDKIYVVKYYRDPELLKTQSKYIVFAMDCSGNTRKDYSTLVGVDVTNSEVVCTMRVNGFSITRFAQAVGYILLYLFPEAILVGERNYVGRMVLEVIASIIGPTRIYKDEKDAELGVNLVHKLREVMSGDVLRVSVVDLGKMTHDKTIIDEIAGLITDKNGRIDHKQNGGHDDLLISYLYCRWFIMYCKTKRNYIDEIYFNSRLSDILTDAELEELSKYSNDRFNYAVVSDPNGETKMNIEKEMKNRDKNNSFVLIQIKNAVDSAEPTDLSGQDYFDAYDNTPKIKESDISVDTVSEENKDKYHQYTEDLDKDDPDKIAKETEEIRDTSKDPPKSLFNFSFMTGFKSIQHVTEDVEV